MNIKDYFCVSHHLFLAINLQPTTAKSRKFYIFVASESRRSLGRKNPFLISLGYQIEIHFYPHPDNNQAPLIQSFKMILERQKSKAWSKNSNNFRTY